MLQRGRRSAEQLALRVIDNPRPSLEPPRGLTKAERSTFTELALTARHLGPSDAPLLASLVQAITLVRKTARDPSRFEAWEKATRVQAMLSRSLRLTPQARTDAKTVGRQQPPSLSYYDRMRVADDET